MNSIIYNEKITVIIVSFHSSHIIENLINSLEKNIKILIIENSIDNILKITMGISSLQNIKNFENP